MYEIRHYLTIDGKDLFTDWLKQVKDPIAKVAIGRRRLRMEQGNFGDHKFCREGVWKLRIDVDAGYRMYHAIENGKVILLLSGRDKKRKTQTLIRLVNTGKIGRGENDYERQMWR